MRRSVVRFNFSCNLIGNHPQSLTALKLYRYSAFTISAKQQVADFKRTITHIQFVALSDINIITFTSLTMLNRLLIIALFAFIPVLIFSQNCSTDFAKLPKLAPDYSFSALNKVFEQSTECKIVFSEGLDTVKYKKISTRLTGWFLNDKTTKEYLYSSSVKPYEVGDKYLLIGLINDFQNLQSFNLPLSLKKRIWSFGKIPINSTDDAIVIINQTANCLAVLGNSYESIENITFRWLGFFDYYILKDNSIKFYGNLQNGKFNPDYVVDLDKIRKENYTRVIENEFIKARFSCSLPEPNKYISTIDSLNIVFLQFCRLFKISMPSKKLDYFIHANPNDLNFISGSPKPGTTGGLVIDGLIHSVGMNIDLLTHEGVHYIFLNSVKYRDSFFNEGVPGFFSIYQHPKQLITDSQLILDYLDYDFKGLIMGQIDFFRGPYKNDQCLSYQISGLFVKYLFDNYGIDKMIQFYKEKDLELAFQYSFNKSLDTIIPDWKQWILFNAK